MLAPWPSIALTTFTDERDLDHPVSAEVEQTLRATREPILDQDGEPVLHVEIKFLLVEPGIDLNALSQSTLAVRLALCAIGGRRYPPLCYDFHDDSAPRDNQLDGITLALGMTRR